MQCLVEATVKHIFDLRFKINNHIAANNQIKLLSFGLKLFQIFLTAEMITASKANTLYNMWNFK